MSWNLVTSNAPWGERGYHTSVVFDGKMWVMGGVYGNTTFNDVWNSTDGVNWTRITSSAGWTPRYCHSSVVFDDKIWVMGGWIYGSGKVNDVWYSSNGASWTQATSSAQWPARYYFGSVTFDGKIWISGGIVDQSSGGSNDTWYSTDGVDWTLATVAGNTFSDRFAEAMVVYDDKIWILGGKDWGPSVSFNDVWTTDGLSSGVENNSGDVVEPNFYLTGVQPNPFREHTNILYSLSVPQIVDIRILDSAGRLVKNLTTNIQQSAGDHSVQWSGCAESGATVSPGVYFVSIQGTEGIETCSIVFLQ